MKRKLRELFSWIICIAIALCAAYLTVTYVAQITQVVGDSMMNTLQDEDKLIMDKISYRFREPKRFEIIVFPYRHTEKETHVIKRIIGLPGETIQIKEGYVYINEKKLDESYGLEVIEEDNYGIAAEPITLGKNEYFVLGDNRNNSTDSRVPDVGPIHKIEIEGRAWLRIWPFDSFGVLSHE